MAEITVHLTIPARPAFGLDTVERRIALYTCAQPLTLSMRGNRAHLATLAERPGSPGPDSTRSGR